MKPLNYFKPTFLRTSDLTDNQRIIRDHTSFTEYLDVIGNRKLSFHQYAGEFKRHLESKKRSEQMPTREEFGYALLRLVQERLLEMV